MNLVSTQSQQDSKNKAAKNENELLNSLGNQILLPEKPVVIIEPSKSWVALNLRDLWQYRNL